ncbi:MAG: hypothetical protein JOY84_15200 [Curvibacter sp.]|nr:hypothetical protein [Curvibacter sp.]
MKKLLSALLATSLVALPLALISAPASAAPLHKHHKHAKHHGHHHKSHHAKHKAHK